MSSYYNFISYLFNNYNMSYLTNFDLVYAQNTVTLQFNKLCTAQTFTHVYCDRILFQTRMMTERVDLRKGTGGDSEMR